MLAQQDRLMLKCRIGYFPAIDSPAVAANTIHEILCKALQVRNAVEIESVVIVFDQVIHTKAVDATFKNILLQLRTFHAVMVILSIIGK